ncbi:MAG: GH3 auxin-responsive promoter family protein [Nanoarchaeota archaeon]
MKLLHSFSTFLLHKFHFIQRHIASKYRKKFLQMTSRCKNVQEKNLFEIIELNKDCEYGVEHKFKDIKSYEDFKKNVPVNDYSDLKPYVDKMLGGQKYCLTSKEVVFYAKSSGTTNYPKYIPVTKNLINKRVSAWKIWTNVIFENHPDIYVTPNSIINFVSKPDEEKSISGVNCGSISGLLHEIQPLPIKMLYAIPEEISEIEDYELKYYLSVIFGIKGNIKKMVSPNPSTFVYVGELINKKKYDFLNDFKKNKICALDDKKYNLSTKIRRKINAKFKSFKNRSIYLKLKNLISENKVLLPKHIFPNLEVIGCWTGGSVKTYLTHLPFFYGDLVEIYEIGFLASEGRFTTITNRNSEVLSIDYGFFEFMGVKDYEKHQKRAKTYLAHELKKGEKYYVLVTSENGLFRYFMDDIVRVNGFENKTPKIEFLQKGKYVSSVTGEKITEWEIVDSMKKASEKLGFEFKTFFAIPLQKGEFFYYAYGIEFMGEVNRQIICEIEDFLDKNLRKENIEYAGKRKSERLLPLRVIKLSEGSFFKIRHFYSEHVKNNTQIKVPKLAVLDKDKKILFNFISKDL